MNDDILYECNETELLEVALSQGLGRLRRGLPVSDLVAIVSGHRDPKPEEMAGTMYTRQKLEEFLEKHWSQVRSQLPGCNGKCQTFKCSETRHMLCFTPNQNLVM